MSDKVRLCPDKIIFSNIALVVVVQLKMTLGDLSKKTAFLNQVYYCLLSKDNT